MQPDPRDVDGSRSGALSYSDAGVDREAASQAVKRIKAHVRTTFTPGVLTDIGSFGALFQLDVARYKEPVLVSSTDGVGTKLKIAFAMNRHDTVGIDLVAMCVNDVLAQGAKPLFFLDYFATGKLLSATFEEVISGIVSGCREAGCALIGGENAELPDFYQPGEYDLAGFCVGVVEKESIIDGSTITPGDVILGLPSSGIHSNGYSLARKVLLEIGQLKLNQTVDELGCALGEELLKPTRIYVEPILSLLKATEQPTIKGLAHITGGGLIENVPRVLPRGTRAVIQRGTWSEHDIFSLIQHLGNVPTEEMFRTFNMGVGMALVVDANLAYHVQGYLEQIGIPVQCIGRIVEAHEEPSCLIATN